MNEFEIRILNRDGSPSITTSLTVYSVQSAIGSAVRLARGRPFEVWTEGRCVYTNGATIPPPPPAGSRPAA
jgi:hypothetical protein